VLHAVSCLLEWDVCLSYQMIIIDQAQVMTCYVKIALKYWPI